MAVRIRTDHQDRKHEPAGEERQTDVHEYALQDSGPTCAARR